MSIKDNEGNNLNRKLKHEKSVRKSLTTDSVAEVRNLFEEDEE